MFHSSTKLKVMILSLAVSAFYTPSVQAAAVCDLESRELKAPCLLKESDAVQAVASMNFNNSQAIENFKTGLASRVSEYAFEATVMKVISPSMGPVPSQIKYEVVILSDSKLSDSKRLKGRAYLWTVVEKEQYDWNYYTYTNSIVEVNVKCTDEESNAQILACARTSILQVP